MNIVLWVLQILLALHTLVGALWKFTNTPEQAAPSFVVIPHIVWLALAVIEIAAAVGLALPILNRKHQKTAGIAALVVVAEMIGFTVLHFLSAKDPTPIVYWLAVAVLGIVVGVGRLKHRAS